jgi:hypothetical protein
LSAYVRLGALEYQQIVGIFVGAWPLLARKVEQTPTNAPKS